MSDPMRVTVWGVRGSVPSPGPQTVRYGGNTSCISVEADGRVLVLDAGSGIRELGKRLMGGEEPIYVVLTHIHWDHIQGFPFFLPIYQPGRKIYMFPSGCGKLKVCSLVSQMDGSHFPVTPDALASDNECVLEAPMEFLNAHGFGVRRLSVNHPAGAFGYRLERDGKSLVYIPDNELEPPGEKTVELEELAEFCRGADVLIHDAQYLPTDMPRKHGWGHSVVDQVLKLGAIARPKNLILFHHDPDRTDDQVAEIERTARAWCADHCPEVNCMAAREGMEFLL